MKKALVLAFLTMGLEITRATDLDLGFGEKGRVQLNEVSEKASGNWFVVQGDDDNIRCVSSQWRDKEADVIHAYKLHEDGRRVNQFGTKGYTLITLDNSQWAGLEGNHFFLNKLISSNTESLTRFVVSPFNPGAQYVLSLDYSGKAEKKPLRLDQSVDDVVFFSDGTFLTSATEGRRLTVSSYQKDGSPLKSFGNAGSISYENKYSASKINVLSEGKIQFSAFGYPKARTPSNGIKLFQTDSKGNLFLPFGEMGSVEYTFDPVEWISQLDVDGKGRTTLYTQMPPCRGCRSFADLRLWRVGADGRLDWEFGQRGYIVLDKILQDRERLTHFVTDKQGRLLLLTDNYGNNDATVIRLAEDGEVDNTFGEKGRLYLDRGASSVTIQRDGKYLIAGFNNTGLWLERYTP